MADMIFFEKPGCINGEKQKKILQKAGHRLNCFNILETQWSKEKLVQFVKGRKAVEVMNHTAPAIKNGSIQPEKLTLDEAILLMISDPILIKRPLIQVDGLFIQGFNNPHLSIYLGEWDGQEDVTTCPNLHTLSCDEKVIS